jgi:Tol biopolymer transport system component
MRKLVVFRVMLTLFLVATLLFVSIVKAGTWGSPSMVTDHAFSDERINERFSISGDGSKIAFVGGTLNFSGVSDLQIFVINSDGTGLTQLTNNTEFNNPQFLSMANPSISGNTSKIAFQYDDGNGWEIFTINIDGTELAQLTDNTPTGDCLVSSSDPSISDDGSKIAFFHVDFSTYNRGIFVINSDGTGMKQLTENFDRDFTMSGDGTKIAFLGGDDFDFQYFVINSDGTELTKLTQNTNRYQDINYNANPPYAPSISDDGSKIAFEGYVGSDREIFIINSDGTGLKQLTDNDEDDWAPAISGDGSRIAFQRTEYQKMTSNPDAIKPIKPQVYVINSDGTGLAQLTNKTEEAFWNPSISDNGEKIAFWSYFYDPEEIEPEKTGISLVNYLADAEDENDGGLIVPAAMVIGGILPIAVGAMLVAYLKKRKPW